MGDVTVSLTSDEALVLFELLHRWEDAERIDSALLDGEQTALWNLSAKLELVLVVPFDASYGELVEAARARLGQAGGA